MLATTFKWHREKAIRSILATLLRVLSYFLKKEKKEIYLTLPT